MSKFVKISDLEQGDQRDPIWALNGSSESEVGAAGEVHVGIPKVNGNKTDDLYLPQTWLPINLTDQIPRGQLLVSSEFRNAVTTGLVVLISAEFAAELEQGEGVTEERQRLNDLKRHVREATAHRSITDSGAEVVSTSEITDRPTTETAAGELDSNFVMFANMLDTKTDIEALNLVKSRGKLLGKELRHLIRELKDKPKTVSFIRAKLKTK